MKNIFILGGLGHIGSGWVRHLSTKFDSSKITIIDNLETQRFSSLFARPKNINRFVNLDIRSPELVNELAEADIVFQFAALTNADPKINNSHNIWENNVVGTKNVIAACKKLDVPLVFPSSTSVYEKSSGQVNEETQIEKPDNPYSAGKFEEELLLQEYEKGIVLRLGTIHGISPGMRFHTAVNKFCWQAVNGIPLTVWDSSASLTIPYLSLTDLYQVLDQLLNNDVICRTRLINLVSHNSTPTEIIRIINKFVPHTSIQKIQNDRNRLSGIVVESKDFLINNLKFTSSAEKDIESTINLLLDENFSWQKYYEETA